MANDPKMVEGIEKAIKSFLNKMQESYDTDCIMVLAAPKGQGMVIGDHTGNPLMAMSMAREFCAAHDRVSLENAVASIITQLMEEDESQDS